MSHPSSGPADGAARRRSLATDILEEEGFGEDAPDALATVLGALDDLLRPMIGAGGFGAILGRATVVAAEAHPELGRLPLSGDRVPSTDNLADLLGPLEDAAEACVALLAELVTFMGRLIGWRLTLVLLTETWPDVISGYEADDLDPPTQPDEGDGHAAD